MTVSVLMSALELNPIIEGDDREVDSCYIGDLLSWVMGRAQPDCVWLTIMQNVNVAAVARLCDVSCIILCEDVKPDEALVSRLRQEGITLASSPLTIWQMACKLHAILGD